MSANTATDLYQSVIMKHSRAPLGSTLIENPTHVAEGFNPICGDRISLGIHVENAKISKIGFLAQCCALCRASASVMVGALEASDLTKAHELITQFERMLAGDVCSLSGDLAAFECVKEYPARSKCVLLPWKTMSATIANPMDKSAARVACPVVSTETEKGGT